MLLNISIFTYWHTSHGYEEQKVICTRFLSLFLLAMGQEKDLAISTDD
ncbi:hypothetical protein [Bacillus cereus]|nr:hypothetical protein [Bacillus cereus]